MKYLIVILTFLIIFTATNTSAEENLRWYEIEVILFEHSNDERLISEKWEQSNPLVNTSLSRDFISVKPEKAVLKQLCIAGQMLSIESVIPFTVIEDIEVDELPLLDDFNNENTTDNSPVISYNLETIIEERTIEDSEINEELPFEILPKNLNQYNELAQRLKNRREYRTLLHITWRQPVNSEADSRLVRIFAGKNYSEQFNLAGDSRVDIAKYSASVLYSNDLTTIDDPEQSVQLNNGDNQQNLYSGSFIDHNLNVFNNTDVALSESQDGGLLPFLSSKQLDTNQLQNDLLNCHQTIQKITDEANQDVWQLDGNIKIYVERYLHLETDLTLRIPGKREVQLAALETSLEANILLNSINQNDKDQAGNIFGWQLGDDFLDQSQDTSIIIQDVLNKYSMNQKRRLRSNELHYIDHPLFGMIIEIRPYKKESLDF